MGFRFERYTCDGCGATAETEIQTNGWAPTPKNWCKVTIDNNLPGYACSPDCAAEYARSHAPKARKGKAK